MNPDEPKKPEDTPTEPDQQTEHQQATPAQAAAPEPPVVPVPPVAPAQGTPVHPQTIQYVQAPENHEGVSGWLVGWIVYMALWAVSGVTSFFALLAMNSSQGAYSYADGDGTAVKTLTLVFMPLIVIAAIGSILFIAQRKRLGKTFSLAFIGIAGLYTILSVLLSSNGEVAVIAGYITAVLIVCPLQAMYFFQSDRVKKTLTK
jgi:hypothetical protein